MGPKYYCIDDSLRRANQWQICGRRERTRCSHFPGLENQIMNNYLIAFKGVAGWNVFVYLHTGKCENKTSCSAELVSPISFGPASAKKSSAKKAFAKKASAIKSLYKKNPLQKNLCNKKPLQKKSSAKYFQEIIWTANFAVQNPTSRLNQYCCIVVLFVRISLCDCFVWLLNVTQMLLLFMMLIEDNHLFHEAKKSTGIP